MFQFVDYFIKKAKENHIATFYWMGLSDGMSRLYPAFHQSDLALKMLKAYHGDDYSPTLPDVQNYNEPLSQPPSITGAESNGQNSTFSKAASRLQTIKAFNLNWKPHLPITSYNSR